jgi:hypothetical protein
MSPGMTCSIKHLIKKMFNLVIVELGFAIHRHASLGKSHATPPYSLDISQI